jgi:hypothetical protein
VKVWKSVGAVAVYSKARVTALLLVGLALVAGAGFAAGMLVQGDDDSEASPAPAPVAQTADTPSVEEAKAEPARTPPLSKRAAYRRGYRAGSRQLFGPGGPLRAGSAYFVRAERGPGGVRIGRRERIEIGTTYWLCSGGQRLCMRPGQ